MATLNNYLSSVYLFKLQSSLMNQFIKKVVNVFNYKLKLCRVWSKNTTGKTTSDLLALRGQVDVTDDWQALRKLEINK